MNYEKFISNISKRRKPNLIRHVVASVTNPDAINFGGGMPNGSLFPFKRMSITFDDNIKKTLTGNDLHAALQYGPTNGYPPLFKKWRELQTKWHSIKYDNWDVCFTAGSMEGCDKIFDLVIEPNEPMMLQTPTYSGVLGSLMPKGFEMIKIYMDDDGLLPDDIIRECESRLQSKKPLPKLLYVNPTGANPTGTVYSDKRKQEIYHLAQKYDFLILEDDPYYFLHFLDEQPRSFLSMDTDGRVLRLDSFSKIISAGLRLGVITGPQPLVEKLALHISCTTIHASSLSQMLVYMLLNSWSDDDMTTHFKKIQKFYLEKRDIMLKAVEENFKGIAEWSAPKGGMFIWLKINILEDVYEVIMNNCVSKGLYLLPGHCFYINDTDNCQYIRLSYSHAKTEEIKQGLLQIAEIIRSVAKNKLRK